jgi:hypothetical protein
MRRDSLRFLSCKLSGGPRHASQFSPCLSCGSLSLRYIAGFFFLISFLLSCPHLEAQETVLQLQTVPPLAEVRPFSEAVTMIVSVTRRDGTPIEDGWIQLRLDAPRPGRFFSTDFPFVEGSQLLDMRLPIRQGRVQWQYVFPIRGQYRMVVETVAPDRKTADATFYLAVKESEKKWLFLGFFTLGIFSLGVVAGRLFSAPQLPSRGNVSFWVFLLIFCAFPWVKASAAQEAKSKTYQARLAINAHDVGKLSQIRWTLVGLKEGKSPVVNLSLKIFHLGKGQMVFVLEKIPVAEEFSLNFQFTDGDKYHIDAMAELDAQEWIHSEKTISVSGIEPPPSAAIPTIVFFLAVIALGLSMGRWSRHATAPTGSARLKKDAV